MTETDACERCSECQRGQSCTAFTDAQPDDLYGMELDRRLTAERALAAVLEVVEAYESCGPKRQCTRDVLAAVRAACIREATS